jgi:DNA mismatch repair protein MutL
MGKINVLSFAVANLIAAGEVVDRPSSVIKELLENAIDSGADSITVEIQNGGVTYMRVTDNGCGISKEDLPIAIRRHATSKIKDAEDLNAILTLGFRGEALAAIASVSDMRIISKQKDSKTGAMLESSGGNILGVTDRPCADGTSVIVENLFANVPARKKFLKKDVTEAMSVSAVVEKIALSRPDIFFKLIIDGNVKIETTGDGSLKNTVYAVFGREFASKLIETKLSSDGITVRGFVGRPDNIRANRNYQNFFINGRYVKSRTAMAALEQAYTSYIASERFPCCVLFLDIDPALVDVNVHPAKLEVKFSNEKPIFETVYYAVRAALENNSARPNVELSTSKRKVSDAYVPIEDGRRESAKSQQIEAELYRRATPLSPSTSYTATVSKANVIASVSEDRPKQQPENSYFSHITAEEYRKNVLNVASSENRTPINVGHPKTEVLKPLQPTPIRVDEISKPVEPIKNVVPTVAEIKTDACVQEPTLTQRVENLTPIDKHEAVLESLQYRVVGEVFNSYVIVERGSEMLLIDKHAAHERIIFEQLKAGLKDVKINSQMLMLPIEIMMTSDEIQAIIDYRSEVEAVGFEFTVGKYAISVTAIPEGIDSDGVADMILVMAERIKSGTGSAGLTKDIIFEKALYQASCKAAIKAGREYSKEQIKRIVDKLMEIPDITVCPHGRPVAMILDKKNLDRQFERT